MSRELPGWLLLVGAWLVAILLLGDLPAVATRARSEISDSEPA